jgi:hypothetical protein
MIKVTYEITLNAEEFETLRWMVKEHRNKGENCSSHDAKLYDLFKID